MWKGREASGTSLFFSPGFDPLFTLYFDDFHKINYLQHASFEMADAHSSGIASAEGTRRLRNESYCGSGGNIQ